MKKLFSVFLVVLMLAGMLAMTVSAEGTKQAWVRLPGENAKGEVMALMITINEGDVPTYYLTNEYGLVTTTGATADNYNIKLEYPAGGTATLYLKGAYLKNSQRTVVEVGRIGYSGYKDITNFPFIINVEADSKIEAPHRGEGLVGYTCIGGSNKDLLTITGAGELHLVAHSNHCISCGNILVKDANIKGESLMPTAWGVRAGIYAHNSEITIDNSVLDFHITSGPALWNCAAHNERVGDPHPITIKNGSKIKAIADIYSTENSIIGSRGTITIDNSEVELTSTGAAMKKGVKCFLPKPVLVGVSAVAGTTSDKVEEYNPKKNSTYYYFKCGTNLELPTEPTEPTPTTPVDPKPTDPTPTTPNTPDATTPDATTPDATTPDATTPDATTPGATTPNATTPNATKPAATNPTTGNNNTTTTPDTDKNDTDKADDKGGIPVILWVVIGVVVAGGIAAAVVILLKKKGAAKADAE